MSAQVNVVQPSKQGTAAADQSSQHQRVELPLIALDAWTQRAFLHIIRITPAQPTSHRSTSGECYPTHTSRPEQNVPWKAYLLFLWEIEPKEDKLLECSRPRIARFPCYSTIFAARYQWFPFFERRIFRFCFVCLILSCSAISQAYEPVGSGGHLVSCVRRNITLTLALACISTLSPIFPRISFCLSLSLTGRRGGEWRYDDISAENV